MKTQTRSPMPPLLGIKIVEFEGIGPGPLAGFMLMQMGADVTVVGRPGAGSLPDELTPKDGALLSRGKRRVTLNLKRAEDKAQALELVAQSDGVIEGNRPGVMERLGLGPDVCGERNPRLVYGRMTGWGQDGPLAQAAGHDMNYVALTGLMSLTEQPGHPHASAYGGRGCCRCAWARVWNGVGVAWRPEYWAGLRSRRRHRGCVGHAVAACAADSPRRWRGRQ